MMQEWIHSGEVDSTWVYETTILFSPPPSATFFLARLPFPILPSLPLAGVSHGLFWLPLNHARPALTSLSSCHSTRLAYTHNTCKHASTCTVCDCTNSKSKVHLYHWSDLRLFACLCSNSLSGQLKQAALAVWQASIVIGASLSEPHTSVTALSQASKVIGASLSEPHTSMTALRQASIAIY